MAKYLRDISIYSFEQEDAECLGGSTNFLQLLYLDSLPKLETGGVAKVVLTPCRHLPDDPLRVLVNPDVLQFHKVFAFREYLKADKERRKRMALTFLHQGMLEVAKSKGWNSKPLQEAYKTVLAKGLVNEGPWRWSKAVTSPNRKLKAQAWVNYDSDKADVFIVVTRGGQIVSKTPVASVKPGDVWINEIIGKIEWITPAKTRLISKDGKQTWNVEMQP